MVDITSYAQAKVWHPKIDDAQLRVAWKAAEEYVSQRVEWSGDIPPAALVMAVKLMTARLLQREKSPEGVVGMDPDGLGAVRVPQVDVDVIALIAPYRMVAFG